MVKSKYARPPGGLGRNARAALFLVAGFAGGLGLGWVLLGTRRMGGGDAQRVHAQRWCAAEAGGRARLRRRRHHVDAPPPSPARRHDPSDDRHQGHLPLCARQRQQHSNRGQRRARHRPRHSHHHHVKRCAHKPHALSRLMLLLLLRGHLRVTFQLLALPLAACLRACRLAVPKLPDAHRVRHLQARSGHAGRGAPRRVHPHPAQARACVWVGGGGVGEQAQHKQRWPAARGRSPQAR